MTVALRRRRRLRLGGSVTLVALAACSPVPFDCPSDPTWFERAAGEPIPLTERLCPYGPQNVPQPPTAVPGCRVDFGNFAPTPPPAPGRLRVVVWNIARGEQYDAILASLTRRDADLLLLSELDRGMARSGNRDVAAELARALGMDFVYAVEFIELVDSTSGQVRGEHGQAILSRYPLGNVRVVRLSPIFDWSKHPTQPRWGNRISLSAEVGVGPCRVRLFDSHFESVSTPGDRLRSMREVLAAAADGGALQIHGGDLNTGDGSAEPAIQESKAAGFADPFPGDDDANCTGSGTTCRRIDWALFRGPWRVPVTAVGDYDGSDHKWLRVEAETAPR